MGIAASCSADELASAAAIEAKNSTEEDSKYTPSRSSSCSWLSTRSSSEILESSPSPSHIATAHLWSTRRLAIADTSLLPNNRPRITPHNKILPVAAKDPPSSPPSATSTFPRCGHSLSVATSDGGNVQVLLFGGVTRGPSTNDLFEIFIQDHEPSLRLSSIQAGGDPPSPRFGHASVCFRDDLIIWGGDTRPSGSNKEKIRLDNELYVFNRTSEEWSRISIASEPAPRGRYGHAACVVDSKFYMFGGQTEDGTYLSDLWAIDLESLKSSTPRWELVESDGNAGSPSPRSGHICIAVGQKILLFGGKDKKYCYNDTWSFDASTSLWTKLRCSGFIPAPRESHAAALVNDNMYVFGGKGADGSFLGDLGVFSISQQRWHTFRNMEFSPSPRVGHAMIAIGSQITVLGGKTLEDNGEVDSIVHILDTSSSFDF